MREAPLEEPNPANSKVNQPVRREGVSKGKAASAKGKGKKKEKKKTPRGEGGVTTQPEEKEAGAQKEEERVAGQPGKQTRATPPDPLINPEAKGRGLPGCGHRRRGQGQDLRPQEGSVPDKRSRILEVIIVRRIFNLGTGNLEWGGNG
jgi:hypothetical protein